MGARICPRCATRVDERRAKTSPFCLSCGAPLAPNAAPSNPGSTFSGKGVGGGGGHGPPVGLIIGIIAGVIVLGLAVVVVLLVLLSNASTPDPAPITAVTAGGAPPIETPTAPASIVPSASSGKVPPPHTASTSAATASKTGTPVVASAFPRTKAQSEVDRVGSTLAGCKRASGPFGSGSIRVDFESDGRVGTLIRAPFAGTPVGSCISARFQAIRIGAFQGGTQSIEHAFIIQD